MNDPGAFRPLHSPLVAVILVSVVMASPVRSSDRAGHAIDVTYDWRVSGTQSSGLMGWAMATAGDVNGDGHSDVIVSAADHDSTYNEGGVVYVYHGSPTGLLTSPAWSVEGVQSQESLGTSVATAGDVNGDGYSDVLICAAFHDRIEVDEGRVALYLGSAIGLESTPSWVVYGDRFSANLGWSLGGGDVNGDGYDDVILGAPGYNGEGRVFVHHGSATGPSVFPDWIAERNEPGARFGRALVATDVNGDGYSDVVVGAPFHDYLGDTDPGRIFLYLGSSQGLLPTPAWAGQWHEDSAYLGTAIASVGDYDGDGYADVAVGAAGYNDGLDDVGLVALYLGSPSGLDIRDAIVGDAANPIGEDVGSAGDVNGDGLADIIVGSVYGFGEASIYLGRSDGLLDDEPSWTVTGAHDGSVFGAAVAGAGDVDDDGFSDVLVGSPSENGVGAAYAYYGSADVPDVDSWTMTTGQTDGGIGLNVARAGDVDGDGFADVIIGGAAFDDGELGEGRAYLFRGNANGLEPTPSWTVDGDQVDAFLGYDIAGAGDVNGDGFGDLIVGAFGYEDGEADEGFVYVYHGSPSGPSLTPDWFAEGGQMNAAFGVSVSGAGDVNADGYADVVIGAYLHDGADVDDGRVVVYHGSATGLESTPAVVIDGGQADGRLGIAVSTAGDVNADGYADVIAGAYYQDGGHSDEGIVYLYLGGPGGVSDVPAWTAEGDQTEAWFGRELAAAGDVNGDGYADVIVGTYKYNAGNTDEGRAYVYHGGPSGLDAAPAWSVESDQTLGYMGIAVSGAGDLNGDGFADVVVGASLFDDVVADGGRVFAFLGSPSGLTGTAATAPWGFSGEQTGEELGRRLAGVGDVNGDGYADIVATAHLYDGTYVDEGRALLFLGNSGPGRNVALRQLRTDGITPIPPGARSDSENEFRLRATLPSVVGRTDLQLEVEVKPVGVPFDGIGTLLGDIVDTGVTGSAAFDITIGGLVASTSYHWRARCRLDPTRAPYQSHGPWLHIPETGWEEADLATALPAPLASESPGLDAGLRLQVGANPIRPGASLTLTMPAAGRVELGIHDLGGRSLRTLASGRWDAGRHVVVWDGRDDRHNMLAPGVYFANLVVDGRRVATRKLVVVH